MIIRMMVLILWVLALPAQAQTVRYIHTDALGSVVAVTDASRNVIGRREYEPFGAQLTPALSDGPGYTGHVQDALTGLTYMQQRYYDPMLGVFLSVDPVTASPNTGAGFNRYAYAANNPYRFFDPDGRCETETGSRICRRDVSSSVRSSGPVGNVSSQGGERKAFSESDSQERYDSATREINQKRESMEGKVHGTSDDAARTFRDAAQPVSTKYGVEVESLIEQNSVGKFRLTGTMVGDRFNDGIGYTVSGPTDGLPTAHTHPTSRQPGAYSPFSSDDLRFYGASRAKFHYVTTVEGGIFRYDGAGVPVTEVSP